MTDLYLMRNIPTEREKRHTVMYDEYVAAGGYAALKKALLMKPQSRPLKSPNLEVVVGQVFLVG